ncbi:MAG: hypothetical protein MJY84_04060 [Bacteroidales bacterium]|nr:hypothetical protein [Bacteroidales bacterium]
MKSLSLRFSITAAIMAAVVYCSCTSRENSLNGKEEIKEDNEENVQTKEQFEDPTFERGLALLAPEAVNAVGVPVDTLYFSGDGSNPCWHLCCWNFENGLSQEIRKEDIYGTGFSDGTYSIFRNKDNVLTMEVISSKVYEKPREDGQNWINFLIETSFHNLYLKDFKSMIFSYDLVIQKCDMKMSDNEYNTNIHAAQCLAYLYVRNTNQASKDYMKSLWLGTGSFDNRDEGGVGKIAQTQWDLGTSTYIFGMSDEEVFGKVDFYDHKWHTCTVDVRKGIAEAINALTKNGFMTESKVDDFEVMGMNYGWELPGTFDVRSQIRNISLKTISE